MTDCLFCKIVAKQIPSQTVWEDGDAIAFLDIKPVNPGHVLVVPKKHSENLLDADPETLARVMVAAQKIARALVAGGICEGFNLGVNNGAVAGQLVGHLHVHVMPRRSTDGFTLWHGTPYEPGKDAEMADRIRHALGA